MPRYLLFRHINLANELLSVHLRLIILILIHVLIFIVIKLILVIILLVIVAAGPAPSAKESISRVSYRALIVAWQLHGILMEGRLFELVDGLDRSVTDEPRVLKHSISIALLHQLLQVSAIIEVRRLICILFLAILANYRGWLLRLSGKIIGDTASSLDASDLHFHLSNL